VKEFYFGLRGILEDAIDGIDTISSSRTFAFTEAVYYAARSLKIDAEAAQRKEMSFRTRYSTKSFRIKRINPQPASPLPQELTASVSG
jgi:hypothetical protein